MLFSFLWDHRHVRFENCSECLIAASSPIVGFVQIGLMQSATASSSANNDPHSGTNG